MKFKAHHLSKGKDIILDNEFVEKYTTQEGGEWIKANAFLKISDIVANPRESTYHYYSDGSKVEQYVWGDIHSFVTKSGKRFDAFNYRIIEKLKI